MVRNRGVDVRAERALVLCILPEVIQAGWCWSRGEIHRWHERDHIHGLDGTLEEAWTWRPPRTPNSTHVTPNSKGPDSEERRRDDDDWGKLEASGAYQLGPVRPSIALSFGVEENASKSGRTHTDGKHTVTAACQGNTQ